MLAGLGGGTHGRIGSAKPVIAAAPLHGLEEETVMEGVGVEVPELPRSVAVVEQFMPLQRGQRRIVQSPAR